MERFGAYMSDKIKTTAKIITKQTLGPEIYEMWLEVPEIVKCAKPGQFLSLYCKDGQRMLPRPISICEIDQAAQKLRIVYRVAGEGTKEISSYKEGEGIEVLGPLGNGFYLENVSSALLFGGGIGIPPMLELAKSLSCKKIVVLGYRDQNTFLADEFLKVADQVIIATQDGSVGVEGNVIDAINQEGTDADMIFACGPTPMLRGIKAFASEKKIKAQLSLEEKMACGIGACLACVCKSKDKDHHTNVNNKRICKDGPVFFAEEIEL